MREALTILGFGPCHHMFEVMANEDQKRLWHALAKGAAPDWNQLFAGYVAPSSIRIRRRLLPKYRKAHRLVAGWRACHLVHNPESCVGVLAGSLSETSLPDSSSTTAFTSSLLDRIAFGSSHSA